MESSKVEELSLSLIALASFLSLGFLALLALDCGFVYAKHIFLGSLASERIHLVPEGTMGKWTFFALPFCGWPALWPSILFIKKLSAMAWVRFLNCNRLGIFPTGVTTWLQQIVQLGNHQFCTKSIWPKIPRQESSANFWLVVSVVIQSIFNIKKFVTWESINVKCL